ncbi:MAG: tRNA lysidine(34) synthetase TilS [Clostridia bacterium]|nr:tRNA lysidine(34) synthetase TilS [Clostridia bacterium]
MINIDYNFNNEQVILAGVSGGADSMVLLDLLHKKELEIGFKLICVHVNHNIRGKESLNDQKLVEDFCKKNNIAFKLYNVFCLEEQKKTKETLEEVARRMRYNCFFEAFSEFKADYLFLAHHKNDQAETILMNIIRGTGVSGAIGIKKSEKIIRPLIEYTKNELIDYAKTNNIKFCLDQTNLDNDYTRNYIRNVIIPDIENINPNFINNLCSFSDKLLDDENYFSAILPYKLVKFNQKNKEIYISNDIFKYRKPIIVRLVKYCLNNFDWSKDIFNVHYDKICELKDFKSGTIINLPHSINVIKSYDKIIITKNSISKVNNEVAFKIGKTKYNNKTITIERCNQSEVDFNLNSKFADYDKIPADAVFRTRKNGDIFTKIGSGTVKLSDYLIDKKIPQRERDNLILLASGKNILWICGVEISSNIIIDSSTENFIKLSYLLKS